MQRSFLHLFVMLTLLGGCAHPHQELRRRPLLEIWLTDVRSTFCVSPVKRTPMIPVQGDMAPEATVSQYAPPPLSLEEWVAEMGGVTEVVANKTLRVVLNEAPVAGHLSEMPTPESISDLELNDVDLTEADWAILQTLESLTILQLNGTGCDDQRLELLPALGKLELLSLARNDISNQGLKQLVGMQHLRFLILDETPIDDEGVYYLKQMKQLEGLSLVGTKVSAAEIEKLKSELTECTVVGREPNNIPVPAPEQATSASPRPMPVVSTMPEIRPESDFALPATPSLPIESRPLCAWSANGESVAMYVPGEGCITVAVRDHHKPRKILVKEACVEIGFADSEVVLAVTRSRAGRLDLQRWNALSGTFLSRTHLPSEVAAVQFVFGSPLMMLEGHDGTTQLVNHESQQVIWKDGRMLPEATAPSAMKGQNDVAVPLFR